MHPDAVTALNGTATRWLGLCCFVTVLAETCWCPQRAPMTVQTNCTLGNLNAACQSPCMNVRHMFQQNPAACQGASHLSPALSARPHMCPVAHTPPDCQHETINSRVTDWQTVSTRPSAQDHHQLQGENLVGCSSAVWNCCTPGVIAAIVSRQACTCRDAARALQHQTQQQRRRRLWRRQQRSCLSPEACQAAVETGTPG